jgi:uncharacterized membrane protein
MRTLLGKSMVPLISKKRVAVVAAQAGVMAALVAVATFFVQIPIPPAGYLNFGDIIIFISALFLGPVVGGFAGSVGSAIADLASPYGYFAPFTFVIKGAEGVIAGLIANKVNKKRDVAGVVLGGVEMVIGYLIAQFFGLSQGLLAFEGVPFNILQAALGGLVGIPLVWVLRKRLPQVWQNKQQAVTA